MRRLILTLAALLLLSGPASAETKVVRFQLVCGYGADCAKVKREARMGLRYLEEALPVRFEMVGYHEFNQDITGDLESALSEMGRLLEDSGKATGAAFNLVLTPPFPVKADRIDYDHLTIFGVASGIGVAGREHCVAWVKMIGNDATAARIVAHEVSHLFGGRHGRSGLMGTDAETVQLSDRFSPVTIDEMRAHVESYL